MKFLISLLAATFLGVSTLQAQATKPATTKTLKTVGGKVSWVGYGVGKSHPGTINVKSGEVTLGAKDVLTSAHFVLDMKSLHSPDSDKLTGHLKNADFFDVEKYPEAHFKTTSVEAVAGGKSYKLKGDLTIKDKTEPIEFEATVSKAGNTYTAKASTQITDRTKYGINYNSQKFSTVSKLGDKLIQDNIKIDLDVTAK